MQLLTVDFNVTHNMEERDYGGGEMLRCGVQFNKLDWKHHTLKPWLFGTKVYLGKGLVHKND